MNELQVKVQQEIGTIHWNFEELKTALGEEMQKYENAVYDDTMIKDAKNDVAILRKLRKAVEERRKEIKNKCLKPYELIESQAKELVTLIDKPINQIDKQVKEYEESLRVAKKNEILAYMQEVFADLPEKVATKLKFKTYDSKWENKTATKKTWQDAIVTAHDNILGDIKVLEGIEEEFRETATEVYQNNLVLSEALNKVNELRRQKEMILERERQRKEEEERRRARAEQEAQRQAAMQAQAQTQTEVATHPQTPMGQAIDSIERGVFQQAVQPQRQEVQPQEVPSQMEEPKQNAPQTIQIIGSEQQYKKILGYIEFVGAKYVEV